MKWSVPKLCGLNSGAVMRLSYSGGILMYRNCSYLEAVNDAFRPSWNSAASRELTSKELLASPL